MAIASKPTRGLNVFAFKYVNSQCQHDSLILKLAAKLHLFAVAAKFPTDFLLDDAFLARVIFRFNPSKYLFAKIVLFLKSNIHSITFSSRGIAMPPSPLIVFPLLM